MIRTEYCTLIIEWEIMFYINSRFSYLFWNLSHMRYFNLNSELVLRLLFESYKICDVTFIITIQLKNLSKSKIKSEYLIWSKFQALMKC